MGIIQGRTVRRAPHQYTVVWYENSDIERQIIETDNFYLVPLRGLEHESYSGDVFNMAFHKDYKMTDPDNTDARTLLRAAEIGREAGLRFVHAGNLPGQVGEYEDTFCPQCNFRLIRRFGYIIKEYHITASGTCPKCDQKIPGLWHKDPSQVVLNGLGMPLPVY